MPVLTTVRKIGAEGVLAIASETRAGMDEAGNTVETVTRWACDDAHAEKMRATFAAQGFTATQLKPLDAVITAMKGAIGEKV
jgi:hypothetical protein